MKMIFSPSGVEVSAEPSKLEFNSVGQSLAYTIRFSTTWGSNVVGSSPVSSFGWVVWSKLGR